MLDQEDDPELDDEWLTADERLTHSSKYRERIVGSFKGEELTSVQGPQYSEEYLVVRESSSSSTKRPPVSESITNRNNVTVFQVRNNRYSTYSR